MDVVDTGDLRKAKKRKMEDEDVDVGVTVENVMEHIQPGTAVTPALSHLQHVRGHDVEEDVDGLAEEEHEELHRRQEELRRLHNHHHVHHGAMTYVEDTMEQIIVEADLPVVKKVGVNCL